MEPGTAGGQLRCAASRTRRHVLFANMPHATGPQIVRSAIAHPARSCTNRTNHSTLGEYMLALFHRAQPQPTPGKMLAASLGGMIAIGVLGAITAYSSTPLIMAPFGASCVLLFFRSQQPAIATGKCDRGPCRCHAGRTAAPAYISKRMVGRGHRCRIGDRNDGCPAHHTSAGRR